MQNNRLFGAVREGPSYRVISLRWKAPRALLALMGKELRYMAVAAVLLLPPGAAMAASQQYNQCIAVIAINADEALSQAETWKARGGGAAADHCAALALIALKRPAEAAARLEALAQLPGGPRERAIFFAQAGNAWLLAGQAQNAESALSSALTLTSNDADLLIDRASARAMRKDWAGAEADLTRANELSKTNPEILVLRASARSAQGRKVEARADIDAALALNPVFGDALVERGAMKFAAGDREGARADWQQAMTAAPGSAAAAAARKYLQGLDSNPQASPSP